MDNRVSLGLSFDADFLHADLFPDISEQLSKLKVHDAIQDPAVNFKAENSRPILAECLSSCATNLLDECILKEILPLAQRSVFEILKNFKDPTGSWRNENLSMSRELLDLWAQCLEHVRKLTRVSASCVRSLLETVPGTVEAVFEHCKKSRKIYEDSFDAVSKELTSLFCKGNTILKLFVATLDAGVIVFDTDVESETELSVEVINQVGKVASTMNGMDLKSYIETCKGFGKMAITCQNSVKRIYPESVTRHIERIAKDASSSTVEMLKNEENRMEERTIKANGFLLKILDRLFQAYHGYVKKEIVLSMIELLSIMHSCSPSCLRLRQLPEKKIDLTSEEISSCRESFLNTLCKTADFKEAYFDHAKRNDIDALTLHLLTLSIVRKLSCMPYEYSSKWITGTDSILNNVFLGISNVQEEICAGEIEVDVPAGGSDIGNKRKRKGLYEASLFAVSNLIRQVPAEGFHTIELLLSKHLLAGPLWSSLLSVDSWCFVARLASPDLCVSHIKYLSRVYSALGERKDSFALVILESLIRRLYGILPQERRDSLAVELLARNDSRLWLSIRTSHLSAKANSTVQHRLVSMLGDLPKAIPELYGRPTVQNWKRLTMLLAVMGKVNRTQNRETCSLLCNQWDTISKTIKEFEGKKLNAVSEYAGVLLKASRPANMPNDLFERTVGSIATAYVRFPADLRILTARYLRENSKSLGGFKLHASNVIAELNCRLLEDENPWVRQEAFESFDLVAHTCPDDSLVARMAARVTKRPSIRDAFPAYLSKASYRDLRYFSTERAYSRRLGERSKARALLHACPRYKKTESRGKLMALGNPRPTFRPPPLRPPSKETASRQIARICDQLDQIAKRKERVDRATVTRIRSTFENFLNAIVPE